ncbi:hypothetical protein N7481_005637 [Penicillium waksmanii]|uniref:uncharacterized protein n=1 Tax=Penicillium waksmanii TaxID=69791 RepID=UPI002547C9E3|nr:uncharacterized protein N7481_005637 [Penicillium waksmanii]KAJ5983538.1 hypothetical protein N7481_005637 [Penicillium waksmanii]
MTSMKVAIAGATGAAGIPMIQELLAAGHLVTALTRVGSSGASKLPSHPNLSIVAVDYESISSLTNALEGHQAVVACFGVATPIGSQDVLIDASVVAGVSRFFPAEFGTDTDNSRCANLPVFANKVHALEYLKKKVQANPGFSYTALCPGAFLDWGLKHAFFVDPKTHSATIYDGGNLPFSTTTLTTISKAVVSILAHLEETQNRHLYIHDAVVTQNQLIAIAKKIDGKDWDLAHTTTSSAEASAYEELEKEKPDPMKFLFPLLQVSVLAEGYGGDFSAHLDNKLLGIEGMDDAELASLMARYL